MSLRDQLEMIREKHGYLDPEVVVAEARHKNHPLHGRFEWDDKVAGEAWRREQAHRLIQSVRIKYTANEQPKDVRAYLPVPRPDSPRPTYEPTEDVMRDEFTRRIVLAQMEREWQTLKSRYGDLTEFGVMVAASLEGAA
jgi:hypothetical protein